MAGEFHNLLKPESHFRDAARDWRVDVERNGVPGFLNVSFAKEFALPKTHSASVLKPDILYQNDQSSYKRCLSRRNLEEISKKSRRMWMPSPLREMGISRQNASYPISTCSLWISAGVMRCKRIAVHEARPELHEFSRIEFESIHAIRVSPCSACSAGLGTTPAAA